MGRAWRACLCGRRRVRWRHVADAAAASTASAAASSTASAAATSDASVPAVGIGNLTRVTRAELLVTVRGQVRGVVTFKGVVAVGGSSARMV